MARAEITVGIIGGSGLDDPQILEEREEKFISTPFGAPSDALICGRISGVRCVLLARHGRRHHLSPSRVPYRANIYALKLAGCTHILATNACGSLQEHMAPGHMVLLDQFIDRTTKRQQTFYDGTCAEFSGVSHMPMAEPFCADTRAVLEASMKALGMEYHTASSMVRPTMVVIEGPRFSTRAESHMFRAWGAHLVGMTTVPEVCLAKELGLCYAAIGLVTDYDCWKDDADHVTVDMVLKTMKENATRAIDLFQHAIPKMAARDWTTVLSQRKREASNCVIGAQEI